MPISNATVYERLSRIENECSRNTYETRLRTLVLLTGDNIYDMCKHPERYVPKIQSSYKSECTQRNMASALLAVFNLFPELKSRKPRAHAAWSSYQKSIRSAYRPTGVSYRDSIAAAYGRLRGDISGEKKESARALLLSMALHAPWAAKGLSTMAAVFPPATRSPSENYVYMCPKKPLIVARGKRAPVPQQLFEDLSAALRAHPRTFLFVGSDEQPFKKQNSFGVYVKRAMMASTGKPIGVNDLSR